MKLRCEFCDKVYHSRSGLNLHIKSIHEGVRYKCSICGNTYAHQQSLESHEKEVHEPREQKLFKCIVCDKGFRLRSELRIHRKTHEDSDAPTCDLCKKVFNTARGLHEHLKRKHDDSKITGKWQLPQHSFFRRNKYGCPERRSGIRTYHSELKTGRNWTS